MRGSRAANIGFDPNKQKVVQCQACNAEIVVGRFSKNKQTCNSCKDFRNNIGNKTPIQNKNDKSFAVRLEELALQLGFTMTKERRWRKKYAIDGGAVATIHPMVEPSVGGKPVLEYFSLTIQQAISIDEEFYKSKILPKEAVSDCEIFANEFGEKIDIKPQIGQQQCDKCGVVTDEFGVDPGKGQVLCVSPNNCFKQRFTSMGAESEI